MIFLHGARQSLEEEEDDDDIFFYKWMAEVGSYSIVNSGVAVQGACVFLIDF